MKLSNAYLDDVLVRMAYHSSNIEGNTITLAETISIILENTISSDSQGVSIREFYEVENHRQAFDYLLQLLKDNTLLSLDIVKEFHSLLLDRLQHDKGQLKQTQNAIIGATFETATPSQTPILVKQWVENTLYRLEMVESAEEIAEVLADTHIQFERIHPFSDGNGRTGRMILMYLAMNKANAPVVINSEYRAEYMRYLAEENTQAMKQLFLNSILFEKERIEKFN